MTPQYCLKWRGGLKCGYLFSRVLDGGGGSKGCFWSLCSLNCNSANQTIQTKKEPEMDLLRILLCEVLHVVHWTVTAEVICVSACCLVNVQCPQTHQRLPQACLCRAIVLHIGCTAMLSGSELWCIASLCEAMWKKRRKKKRAYNLAQQMESFPNPLNLFYTSIWWRAHRKSISTEAKLRFAPRLELQFEAFYRHSKPNNGHKWAFRRLSCCLPERKSHQCCCLFLNTCKNTDFWLNVP